MRRRIAPFSLCFRSFTSPVPRSFHSGRSFSEANRNSFARLEEERIWEVSLHIEIFTKQHSWLNSTVVFSSMKTTPFVRSSTVLLPHTNLVTDMINSNLITNYWELCNTYTKIQQVLDFWRMVNAFGVVKLFNLKVGN